MNCLTAQELISAAMDREPVDATLLAQAKEHCHTCPECAIFVRGQLAVRQAPLPEPPADLADRVMAAIHAEAASTPIAEQTQSAATAPGPVAAPAPPKPLPAGMVATLAPPKPRARRKMSRQLLIGLASAATIVVAIGVAALLVYGGRQMGANNAATDASMPNTARSKSEARTYDYMPGAGTSGSSGTAASTPGAAAPAVGGAGGPQDITVSGAVYTYSGTSSNDVSSMSVLGNTTTSLSTTGTPIQRRVYASLDPSTAYIVADNGKVLTFARATRQYLGQTYVLTSGELNAFGQWPALPAQYAAPTAPDGSPTFTYDGTDSAGVKIYRLANSSAANGIAIAPKSDSSGPAASDPNWTWWQIQN